MNRKNDSHLPFIAATIQIKRVMKALAYGNRRAGAIAYFLSIQYGFSGRFGLQSRGQDYRVYRSQYANFYI